MAKAKVRRLVIGQRSYLWRVTTRVLPREEAAEDWPSCVRFVAYLQGRTGTPLQIEFATSEGYGGNPLFTGAGLNLHKPSYAKLLIDEGLRRGWDAHRSALRIADGMPILEAARDNAPLT